MTEPTQSAMNRSITPTPSAAKASFSAPMPFQIV
jgi:hypothetical protein